MPNLFEIVMPKKTASLHIFYSWQSDSPKKTNLNAIRKALGSACERLALVYPSLKLVPDEATRDTSGSPKITDKIIEKIDAASIFLADITTITAPDAARPCPNPNVGFELGYAVASLGWNRIVLLFNDAIGVFPTDLPFDFAQNRASRYNYALTDPTSKIDALSKLLETAVKAIIDKDPKKPAELRGLTPEKIRHDRDVENMRWLMETIHLPTIQQHIEDLPRKITDQAMWFYENFRGVAGNSLFNVYNPALKTAVEKFYNGWSKALSHDEEYRDISHGSYIFSNLMDAPLNAVQQVAWDDIKDGRTEMAEGITSILDRLRADYLEINIQQTNEHAWKNYTVFLRETEAFTRTLKKKKSK